MRKLCHFDLADFFETVGGASWKWDRAQQMRVQNLLPNEKEVV
jgi:hypothetical protein